APRVRPELPADAPEVVLGIDLGAASVRAAALVDGAAREIPSLPARGAPEEALLAEIAARAEEELGRRVRRVVLTVPAMARAARRLGLRRAAAAVGLEVIRLVSPAAARAAAYGAGHGLARKRLLVLDVGALRVSASVLEITGDEIEVVATAGHEHLGA